MLAGDVDGAAIAPASYDPAANPNDVLAWTRHGYDGVGNKITSEQVRDITNVRGFERRWTYDANQLYATELQRCGDKDGDGLVADDPCDVTPLVFDPLGRLTDGVNGRFEPIEFAYDALNRVIRATDALGHLRTMGIMALYPKARTSRPGKGHRVYPYRLRGVQITRPDQVWAADITYIPMAKGFVYLVAILDWHSRKVLAWRLSNTMDSDFCVEALEEALGRYGKPAIFNTDQGAQFTSEAFTGVLNNAGVTISMDGKGRWVDFFERKRNSAADGVFRRG